MTAGRGPCQVDSMREPDMTIPPSEYLTAANARRLRDAWRDGDVWTWNNHHKVGEISREDFDKLTTNRRLLGYMCKNGYLSNKSQGLVRVDGPGCYEGVFVEFQDRRTGEPLYAISGIH